MKFSSLKKLKTNQKILIVSIFVGILAIIIFSFYFFSSAKIIVYPKTNFESTEFDLKIGGTATSTTSTQEMIQGKVFRIFKQGEQKGFPQGEAGGSEKIIGKIIIFNNSNSDLTLSKKTRLLSKEGILFRMIDRAVIPVKGQKEVDVESDKEGEGSGLEPTSFILPGLEQGSEKNVWGESKSKMSSGKKKVLEEDINKVKQELIEKLSQEGANEIDVLIKQVQLEESSKSLESSESEIITEEITSDENSTSSKPSDNSTSSEKENLNSETPTSTNEISSTTVEEETEETVSKKTALENLNEKIVKNEIVEFSCSVATGDFVSDFTVKIKLQVDVIVFDREALLDLAEENIESSFSAQKELKEINEESLKYILKSYDYDSQEIFLNVSLDGNSQIKKDSQIFNKNNLKGKTKEELINYFNSTGEIEKTEIIFSPSWIKRVSSFSRHITIEVISNE